MLADPDGDPEVILIATGSEVALVMTPAEFDAYLRKDIEKWAQVVKVSGIKAE